MKGVVVPKQYRLFCYCVVFLICISFFSCSKGGNEFLGKWRGGGLSMVVESNGGSFTVDCRTEGFINGKFAAQLTNAGLKVNAGLMGEQIITYSKETDTLMFGGSTLERVK